MESGSLYTEPTAPADAPKPDSTSLLEDFLDIFYAPSQVFARRRDGRFGLALVILLVVCAVLMYALRPAMGAWWDGMSSMQERMIMKSNPQITADVLEKSRGMRDKFAVPGFLFGYLMVVLATGFVLWIVGKLFDAKTSLSQSMMISTYAQIPRFILGTLVLAAMTFFMGDAVRASPFAATIGLPRFFGPDASPGILQLAARVELFTIWATVLLGIGLSVVGGIRRSQAFVAAAVVWLLGALPALISFARSH